MVHMDMRTLSTFRTAARTLSFTKTAASMGYAQSSVTAQMKILEESLGSPLFNRLGNRLELTAPGERFLAYAERILTLAEEAKAAVQDEVGVGTFRLTAPETVFTYLLPPVFRSFTKAFPQVRMEFHPSSVRDFKRQLLEGAVDIAFILEEPFPSKTLAVENLRDEQVLIMAPPTHRLATARQVTAQDLVGEPILLTELGCSYRNQFERQLIASGAHSGHRMEFQSIETIKRCVEQGLGIAPLPKITVTDEITAGRLVALRWKGPDIKVATHLVWNPQRHPGPAVVAFLAHARKAMSLRAHGATLH
jgi:DNA-binding transcriptional LysR family regulator